MNWVLRLSAFAPQGCQVTANLVAEDNGSSLSHRSGGQKPTVRCRQNRAPPDGPRGDFLLSSTFQWPRVPWFVAA